ncbi:MAG: hypothetical protein EON95_13100 [Caulobacteraceae bacterium]|nr:MAG: hypothetical protein EON95_13100 [Caulobacteraceae bacterium]
MLITMRMITSTPDSHAAAEQTVEAFAAALAQAGAPEAAFEKFGKLAFSFSMAHPALQPPGKSRGSYWRDGDTFFAVGDLDYVAWLGDCWALRVGAVAQASQRALAAVFQTRLSPEERATVARLIEDVAERVSDSPPGQLSPLGAVLVSESESGRWLSTSFSELPTSVSVAGGPRTRVLQPAAVQAYFETLRAADQSPQMVKFHKRQGQALLYWEAWIDGRSVVEHAGVCGERGVVSRHHAEGPDRQADVILAIAAAARTDGYEAIPEERLATLLVAKEISGSGTRADLERRHALEDYLNTLTGWLGLGHCDGGSSGSGSMEAVCLVVDYAIAAKAIARDLTSSPFNDFTVRRPSW